MIVTMPAITLRTAIAAIDQHGALLVYPIANKPEPLSLWKVFHPRTKMRWDWDASGDRRVVDLWRMREQLARSGEVVYTKWFQNRATFFSRELFTAMLATYRTARPGGRLERGLDPDAVEVLRALESDSPLGTKQLRALTGLTGRMFEASYTRAVRELFERMLIVGFGEIDEGAFPSLALGATSTLFEDLWDASMELDPGAAAATIARGLPPGSPFARQHAKILARLVRPPQPLVAER